MEVKYPNYRDYFSCIRLGLSAFAVFLLSFFVRTRHKEFFSVGCRSPPTNLDFSKKFRLAYNKAKEENKLRLWKEAEENKLRSLGVDEDTIEKLRVHDWEVFNSDRRFYQRLKDVATYLEEMEADAELPEIRSVDDLLNSIENQKLHQALIMVDKLTLQIVLMRLQGYKSSEIADLLGLSEQTVYKRMQRYKKKIKKILK